MPVSHNGWPASPNPADIYVERYRVPEIQPVIWLNIRKAAAPILLNVAKDFHFTVSRLGNEPHDDGGYNFRVIAGTNVYSNHASGTAIDLNWTKFPRGTRNMTAEQVAACRRIVRRYQVIRWGGDWPGSQVDQMHFEIAADIATVKRTTERLGLTVHGRKRRGRLH